MTEHVLALLVHDHPETFESLRRTLWELSVETYTVATCQDAKDLISQCRPHIVFTQRSLWDGSWQTILHGAEAADVPLSVIVVGTIPDTQLYLSVMEGGAFDFIAPPFEHEPLKFMVRSAALNTYSRREATAQAAAAKPTTHDFIVKGKAQAVASQKTAPVGGRDAEGAFVARSSKKPRNRFTPGAFGDYPEKL